MIARATSDERPFDIVLVHSLSRLFRNATHFMQYRARLDRSKVRIVSITQDFGTDAASTLAVGMMALFDEYHSLENAKHVQRAMLKNASLGFWNGQTPPLGYRSYEATKIGGKSKRKLEIDEDEAFVVRKMFELYLSGPPGSPPLGITRLASWMNDNGYKYRGAPFHVSNVQAVLRNTAYVGIAFYNKRNSKTGDVRPEEEWVPIPIPAIIDSLTLDAVQSSLTDNRISNRPARVTTTNNLLIGIARSGCHGDGCGGGMTASTGKSGRYLYYSCSARARSGSSACRGRRIGRAKLDETVMTALQQRLLKPDRLRALLSGWLDQTADAVSARRETLRQLRTRQAGLEAGIKRLLDLVTDGHLAANDEHFAGKYREQTDQLTQVKSEAILLERQLSKSERRITPDLIARFADLMRARLGGDDPSLRQFYVRSLVARVEVGAAEIRIVGATKALERAVGRVGDNVVATVPSIEREWCARKDSNLRPLDS